MFTIFFKHFVRFFVYFSIFACIYILYITYLRNIYIIFIIIFIDLTHHNILYHTVRGKGVPIRIQLGTPYLKRFYDRSVNKLQ